MKRVLLLFYCVGLIVAIIGTVDAQGEYLVVHDDTWFFYGGEEYYYIVRIFNVSYEDYNEELNFTVTLTSPTQSDAYNDSHTFHTFIVGDQESLGDTTVVYYLYACPNFPTGNYELTLYKELNASEKTWHKLDCTEIRLINTLSQYTGGSPPPPPETNASEVNGSRHLFVPIMGVNVHVVFFLALAIFTIPIGLFFIQKKGSVAMNIDGIILIVVGTVSVGLAQTVFPYSIGIGWVTVFVYLGFYLIMQGWMLEKTSYKIDGTILLAVSLIVAVVLLRMGGII